MRAGAGSVCERERQKKGVLLRVGVKVSAASGFGKAELLIKAAGGDIALPHREGQEHSVLLPHKTDQFCDCLLYTSKKLILMTDVRGLLRDRDDESTLIPVVNVSSVPKLQHDGIISGGMIPKIQCCVEAVRSGVKRAHIIDGRIAHSILIELLTDEGIGTMLY